jgi:hypothetical protein
LARGLNAVLYQKQVLTATSPQNYRFSVLLRVCNEQEVKNLE